MRITPWKFTPFYAELLSGGQIMLLSKGFEVEIYTGTPQGDIVRTLG